MTQEEFLNKIEGCLNDFETGVVDYKETKNNLLELFLNNLQPYVASREHLQLFIYRVSKMRGLQKEYFKGNRQVLKESMKAETAVDNAMDKLLTTFNYSIEGIANKYEQPKLL